MTNSNLIVAQPETSFNNSSIPPHSTVDCVDSPITRPKHITEAHWKEWVEKSGVNPGIVALNVVSMSANTKEESKSIANFVGWRGWQNGAGWKCQGSQSATGCFKADNEFLLNEKLTRYVGTGKATQAIGLPDEAIYLDIPEGLPEKDSGLLIITEGAKKSGALLTVGYKNICLLGVNNFGKKGETRGRRSNAPKVHTLYSGIELAARAARETVILFDADWATKDNVKAGIRDLGASLEAVGCKVTVAVIPQELDNKGIDDVLVNRGLAVVDSIIAQRTPFIDWLESEFPKPEKEAKPKNPPLTDAVKMLLEVMQDSWVYRPNLDGFFNYQRSLGYWKAVSSFELQSEISNLLTDGEEPICPLGASMPIIDGCIKLLKSPLVRHGLKTPKDAVLCGNGVFQNNTLKPHSKEYFFTSQPVTDYIPNAVYPITHKFLESAFAGHLDAIQVLRAFMYMMLFKRADWQVYAEIRGEGGSGKSVVAAICAALAGQKNMVSVDLEQLEKNRFTVAQLADKKLTLVADAEKFQGGGTMVKRIVGCDPLPLEKKMLQPDGEGFVYEGLLLITTNYALKFNAENSAFYRRRRVLRMENVVKQSEQDENLVSKIIQNELPGVLNWVLSMGEESAKNHLKNTASYAPSVEMWGRQQLTDTSSLALWADNNLIVSPEARTRVGVKRMTDSQSFENSDTHLYPNYLTFCLESGYPPMGLDTFTKALESVLVQQGGYKEISVTKPQNKVTFKGLGIKHPEDYSPGILTGQEPESEFPKETPVEKTVENQALFMRGDTVKFVGEDDGDSFEVVEVNGSQIKINNGYGLETPFVVNQDCLVRV